jgi:uncharacterized protein (DUF433 family)
MLICSYYGLDSWHNSKTSTSCQGGTLRVGKTRVSLDSVVYAFSRGENPVEIQRSFDTLSLAEIHGAISYYLHNKTAVDKYLERRRIDFEKRREEDRSHPDYISLEMLLARKLQSLHSCFDIRG